MEELGAGRVYNAVSEFIDLNIERGFANKAAFTDPQLPARGMHHRLRGPAVGQC